MIIKERERKLNGWVLSTLILGIVCLVLVVALFSNKVNPIPIEKVLCSKIQGTPSWGNENGDIVFQGYTNFGDQSWNVVDTLIEDKIYFLYSSGCSWCQEQIKYFGVGWDKYVESKLTIDCSKWR